MRLYVTRHGQPAIGDLVPGTDHETPPGDPVLTDLGRRQAKRLGVFLREESFRGRIFASPYRRTLLTAAGVSAETGAKIYPEPALQEYVLQQGVPEIATLDFAAILSLFPDVSADASIPDRWLFAGPESSADVRARVEPFIRMLLESSPAKGEGGDDVLLVGHGASVEACKMILFGAADILYEKKHNWNCSLSQFVVENGRVHDIVLNCDVSFLPAAWVTSNLTRRADNPGM